MSFFQNVFDFEFRPTILGADRQYQMGWKLPANTNRSDYILSGNAEPYDLSSSRILSINYAYDVNFVNYSTLEIDVYGGAQTTAADVVSNLNADPTFSSLFVASTYRSTISPDSANKVLIKCKKNKADIRVFISNLGAEKKIQFNKNAPIRELPSYFARYTVPNRFVYPNLGTDRVIELDPADPYESTLIAAAGFNPENPKEDWQLLQGVNEAYWTENKTYDGSNLAYVIRYQSGAKAGDLAKKIYYYYDGSNLTGTMDVPYVLKQSDILESPPPLSSLWVWGWNYYGELGTDNTVPVSSPVQTICGGNNWAAVACGYGHTAAIKYDGTLWLWGENYSGELGVNDAVWHSSPLQTVCGGNNWSSVSCGATHTGAVKTDGTLWLWGENYSGQLGDNSTDDKSSPVQTVMGGNDWKQVTCGYAHTLAVKVDGTLWVWGINYRGQLGTNDTTYVSSPVQTIAGGTNWFQAHAGYTHSVAIKKDGTLWTWGGNNNGQLGNGTTNNSSSPAQTISNTNDWKFVSCASDNSVAIKSDGTLWIWGWNNYGQLGNNTTDAKSSPVETICGGNNWTTVDSGHQFTLATKSDGTLWAWGEGGSGQLGNGEILDRSSPVQTIMGGTNWIHAECGYYNGFGLNG
jgi:alpha-tubulin suppressor-like RCC1 family protein